MKITGFELRRIHIPLVSPFRTSFGEQTEREVLLVRAIASEAEGWGECVAMSEPLYSSEYVGAAEEVIRSFLLPRIFDLGEVRPHDVDLALRDVRGHRMAKAALETAM